MGLISLPIMLRYGYNRPVATGAITASGTLAQIVPPSLVLIVIADQLGKSVGDMYTAAFLPAFMLIGLYCLFILTLAVLRPAWVPALPPEARIYREANGASGHRSLLVLSVLCTGAALWFAARYPELVKSLTGNPEARAPTDETVVVALCVGVLLAFVVTGGVLSLGLGELLGVGVLGVVSQRRVGIARVQRWAVIRLVLAAVSLVVSWVLLPTQVEYNRLAHEWQVAASNDPRMREMLGDFDPAVNRRMTLISQVGGSIAVSLVPFGVLLFLGRPAVQRQVERWD
jgi:TRAP-type mannitol/chloroaromatic compound transport system permease large subunit